jgi:hypothetical protein
MHNLRRIALIGYLGSLMTNDLGISFLYTQPHTHAVFVFLQVYTSVLPQRIMGFNDLHTNGNAFGFSSRNG